MSTVYQQNNKYSPPSSLQHKNARENSLENWNRSLKYPYSFSEACYYCFLNKLSLLCIFQKDDFLCWHKTLIFYLQHSSLTLKQSTIFIQQPRTNFIKDFTMKQSNIAKMLDQTIDETDSESKQFHVFLLVNSMSGDRHGQQLIKKFSEPTSFKHNRNITKFYVFDLYVQEKVRSCFLKINKLCQANVNVRIVAGGGDGTVQWVVSESIAHKINFSKVVFSTIPFGTGNDFATSIGWNKFKLLISQKGLNDLAIKLSRCEISNYDVWDCEIQTYPSGKITQIKNGAETQLIATRLKKSFTNYCGIGSDARISYFAQRINASSIFMKKFMYGIAGIWSFFTLNKRLQKSISSFYQTGEKPKNYHFQNQLTQKSISNQEPNSNKQIPIFSTDSCLTFLNSTSSMQIQKIWQTPYTTNPKAIYQEQKVDDGLIEIVGYRNQLSIALERRIHMASKVSQGEGPFTMLFNKGEKQESIYVHINGEPLKIESLKSLVISKNTDIRDGQIKVLKFQK